MISEGYEGVIFAPTPLFQTSRSRTTTSISQQMTATATHLFSSSSMPLLPVYSALSAPPPLGLPYANLSVKGDREDSIEEALAVGVQAWTFDRRNLIVDLRVRSRRHPPPVAVCVAQHIRVPSPDQVSFLGYEAIVLAYITMLMQPCRSLRLDFATILFPSMSAAHTSRYPPRALSGHTATRKFTKVFLSDPRDGYIYRPHS